MLGGLFKMTEDRSNKMSYIDDLKKQNRELFKRGLELQQEVNSLEEIKQSEKRNASLRKEVDRLTKKVDELTKKKQETLK